MAKGQKDRAWEILSPALKLETRNLDCYRIAADLAAQRGDSKLAGELRRTTAEIFETHRDKDQLFRDAFYGEDQGGLARALKALRRIARDLPLTARYWNLKSQAWLGQGALGRAVMCGGEFASRQQGMWADALSLWIHGFGWTPEVRQNMIFELVEERVAKAPLGSGPWLGQGMFLIARYNLGTTRDPDDLDAAAAAALHAAHLSATAPGALGFAADTLASSGESLEAEAMVAAALAAEPLDQFAMFQRARVLTLQGDVSGAIAILRTLGRLDRPRLRRLLREDTVLIRVIAEPEYVDFLSALGR
jgi:tetratricopeptide (TPR) repeat protein